MPMQNAIRPVLTPAVLLIAAAGLSGCGRLDEPVRFETLAERIAAIPVDTEANYRTYPQSAEEAGLRPASAPLRVTVMEPHAMWDARDAMMGGAVDRVGPAIGPMAAEIARHQVQRQVGAAMQRASQPMTPVQQGTSLRPAGSVLQNQASQWVQLGAFSSQSAAQAAWSRLANGNARVVLQGMAPTFEAVEVEGRELVRLKVRAPTASARQICVAAQISDQWCHRS